MNTPPNSKPPAAGEAAPPQQYVPIAWQKFGNEYCLTGQFGMRPIFLSVTPKGQLMLRDDRRDLLKPFRPDHPFAEFVITALNNHAALVANLRMMTDLAERYGVGNDCDGNMIEARELLAAIDKTTLPVAELNQTLNAEITRRESRAPFASQGGRVSGKVLAILALAALMVLAGCVGPLPAPAVYPLPNGQLGAADQYAALVLHGETGGAP